MVKIVLEMAELFELIHGFPFHFGKLRGSMFVKEDGGLQQDGVRGHADINTILDQIMNITDQSLDEAQVYFLLLLLRQTFRAEIKEHFLQGCIKFPTT